MSYAANPDPSLSALQRDAERDRADLKQTVEALQSRLSPSAIRDDVEVYVRDKREGLVQGVELYVRHNPLQAAAVATGIALPLWGLARRVPVPLLLIGAGALLARPGSPRLPGQAGQGGTLDAVRSRIDETTEAVRAKASELSDTLQEKLEHASASMRGTIDRTSSKISDAAAGVSEGAQQARDTVTDNAMWADAAARVRAQAEHAEARVSASIESHPLLIGAIGVGLGAIVAAALPRTRQEERALGQASRQVRTKVAGVVAEGVAAASDTAQRVYQEGLSPEAVKDAAGKMGDKLASVAAGRTSTPERFGENS